MSKKHLLKTFVLPAVLGALVLLQTSCVVVRGGGGGQDFEDNTQYENASGVTAPAELGSFIVLDTHTQKILAAQNANDRRQVASLVKIATAVVVLDWVEGTGASLTTSMQVPASAAGIGGANPIGMVPGDSLTIRDALYGAMMASDNVSAYTLADFVGRDLLMRQGRYDVDPVGHFVKQLNILAKRLGMNDTKFTNPHGLDHLSPAPYSTAADIARLSAQALNKSSFLFYTGQPKREIAFQRAGRKHRFRVSNTNQLVGQSRIDGVKTGLTRQAGPCLVLSAARQNKVHETQRGMMVTPSRMLVVVLGANDRFGLAKHLLDQGWVEYDRWYAEGMPVYQPTEMLANF